MANRKFVQNITGLTDGLNTEASVLNVLSSEMMDGSVNVEVLNNGEVRRRRGVDFIGASDAGGFLQQVRSSTKSAELQQESPNVVEVKLTAPNGDLVDRLIADINNEFHIFKKTSSALKNFDSPYQVLSRTGKSLSSQINHQVQFELSGERLYFTGLYTHPGYLRVASDNVSLEIVYINVLIRDPDAFEANKRVKVTSGSVTRWYECIEAHTSNTANDKPGSGTNWQRYWFQLEGAIPTSVSAWANATSYTTQFIKRYDKDATQTSTDTYPTTASFFAGRLWLAGDPKYPNHVLFTQVIVNDDDVEQFHQFADPFDADDPDLVDSDGGVLRMQGAGLVKQLITASNSMFAGTTTGVWQIGGPDGIFKATNYSNSRVLIDAIFGSRNMVRVEQEVVIFGEHNIWMSEINTNLASVEVGKASFKNLSSARLETLYRRIPKRDKAAAVSLYNPGNSGVYYFYNEARTSFSNSYNPNDQPGYFRNCMFIDARSTDKEISDPDGADKRLNRRVVNQFYKYEFADSAGSGLPYIACPYIADDIPAADEIVVVGTETVTVSGDTVVIAGPSAAQKTLQCLAMQRVNPSGETININAAFGTFNTNSLKDWNSSSTYAVSFSSLIYLGVNTFGSVYQGKNILYIYFVFQKVESGVLDSSNVDITPGGCYLRTAWQFANSTTSNKYSAQQQIYVPDRYNYALAGEGLDGHSHTWYKHRVRGKGHVVQIILENDGDKDFRLVGWAQQFTGTVGV